MKQIFGGLELRRAIAVLTMLLIQTILFAQEEGSGAGSASSVGSGASTSTSKTITHTETWYASPWIWVAVGVVFIALLFALMRGGSKGSGTTRSDSVTVTRSASTE